MANPSMAIEPLAPGKVMRVKATYLLILFLGFRRPPPANEGVGAPSLARGGLRNPPSMQSDESEGVRGIRTLGTIPCTPD
jgi:hypothetical protein